MKKRIRTFLKLLGFTLRPCEKCDSLATSVGYYNRAWNTIHNHAVGDSGWYCNNCGHVTFKISHEEFRAQVVTKHPWIKPYK